jgi:hypothetical protein
VARGGAVQSFRSIPAEAEAVEDMSFSTALDEAITFGIDTDDEQEPLMQWAIRIPEPKTGTLNFERFPFQREFYTELSHDKDGIIQKATQVGVSAWLLRWALYWADTQGLTALYVFPKDKQMSDFSHQRLRPLIKNTEYLMTRVPLDHINNVYLRQIGLGWLNLRGSQTKEALDSVDADVVAFDEYDTLVQENIPDAERRVTGPMSKGLIRRVGVPTVDDYGVSKLYDHSDYRQWFVVCPACNTRQFLHFFQRKPGDDHGDVYSGYVDEEDLMLRCGKCHKELIGSVIRDGEWVAKYPERQTKGYHVHRLMVPPFTREEQERRLSKLVEASHKRSPYEVQIFWNKDLGLPHSEEEGRLSKEALARAQSLGGYMQGPRDLGYDGANLVTAGIDSASTRNLHMRISEHVGKKKKALFIGEIERFDDLIEMMDWYHVTFACIDHLPEGRLARSLAERFPGRVYIARFIPATSLDLLVWDEEQHTAGIKRTEAIDATLSIVRAGRNLLPTDWPEDYVSHMRAASRFYEVDEVGRKTVGYKKLGPDDYLLAEVYDLMATELWWGLEAKQAMRQTELSALDEHLEFERSTVNDPEQGGYAAGPDETGYGIEPPDWSDETPVEPDEEPYY